MKDKVLQILTKHGVPEAVKFVSLKLIMGTWGGWPNIAKCIGDNDDKVDNELPDDDFFDAQPNRAGKIKNVKQDSHKNMADAEDNPDQVIGDFFDKPMMAKKAQMKIKKKLAKMSK